jgi:hypothetical protein
LYLVNLWRRNWLMINLFIFPLATLTVKLSRMCTANHSLPHLFSMVDRSHIYEGCWCLWTLYCGTTVCHLPNLHLWIINVSVSSSCFRNILEISVAEKYLHWNYILLRSVTWDLRWVMNQT